MTTCKLSLTLALPVLMGLTLQAHATEGGGSTYNGGVENFLMAAAPPPGFYVLEYGNIFSSNALRDDAGAKIPVPGFSVKAVAAATRLVWSTPHQIMGGNLVSHIILPLVNLEVNAGGNSQTKTGLGDITFGAGVAFHHSPALHSAIALDIVAPTGGYSQTDMTNIGRNYWSWQPLYTVSYIDPKGFNGDFKLTLNLNQKNKATQYQSGNEVYVDYSMGYGLGNGWTVGAGGYWMQQLSDDTSNGTSVANNKGRAFAIGPSVKYDNGKGWFITAKVQQDMGVRNRAEGTALWLKTIIPF